MIKKFIFFLIINAAIQKTVLSQDMRVDTFILLDVGSNNEIIEISPIQNNAVIDLVFHPTKNFSILAKVSPDTVGSVIFSFDGNARFKVEDIYPYTIAGEVDQKYNAMKFSSGWHTLTCTPFSGPKGEGLMGGQLSIKFKIINSLVDIPHVFAGANELISMPQNKITLKGYIEDNGLPDPPGKLTTIWRVLNSPEKVNIIRPDSLNTDVVFVSEGTYYFQLYVSDGVNYKADTVIIVVRGEPLLPGSLKNVQIPGPDKVQGFDFSQFVVNKSAAIKLGKALFWDMQTGSDGIQACASCHFHAGTDSRTQNQINPGVDKKYFSIRGPNYNLTESSFPFVKPDDDIISSQGVYYTSFKDIILGSDEEAGVSLYDSVFNVSGIKTRRVQPRNSPSIINAVYNYRNNWSGNAQPFFNGVSPEGVHDKNAILLSAADNQISTVSIAIPYSSLASQSVAPVISDIEMSFHGRDFPKIGKKLLNLPPLTKQLVHPEDSELGKFSNYPETGLRDEITYKSLIMEAFNSRWWDSDKTITFSDGQPVISDKKKELSTSEFTLMEANFSLLWGLSIQMYQATLVSDNAKFDQAIEGRYSFSQKETRGLNLFLGKARCINCHSGPEFTNASIDNQKNGKLIDRMLVSDTSLALYDVGFYNIGLRHSGEDPGEGTIDKTNVYLAYSRQYSSGNITDTINYNPETFTIPGEIRPGEKTAVQGTFKVPGLRNIELTGPYFHTGSKSTLMQVIEAYDAGHHFSEENRSNMPLDIRSLELTADEREDLEAFLFTLTDERVRIQSAPFDHPQLLLPHGHPGNQYSIFDDGSGKATQQFIEISETGAEGGPPIKPFLKNTFNVITMQNESPGINTHRSFLLYQNYPNPFNHTTKIKYYVSEESRIKIFIYNSLGQMIDTQIDDISTAGNKEITWNAENAASGVYFYKIETVDLKDGQRKSIVKKMILLK